MGSKGLYCFSFFDSFFRRSSSLCLRIWSLAVECLSLRSCAALRMLVFFSKTSWMSCEWICGKGWFYLIGDLEVCTFGRHFFVFAWAGVNFRHWWFDFWIFITIIIINQFVGQSKHSRKASRIYLLPKLLGVKKSTDSSSPTCYEWTAILFIFDSIYLHSLNNKIKKECTAEPLHKKSRKIDVHLS